jgi:small-conductance mechanosensitive channel
MQETLGERVAGSVRIATEEFLRDLIELLPSIAAALLVLAIFWLLAMLIRRIVRFATQFVDNPTQRSLIRQVSYYLVWTVGLFVALAVLGVDARAVATTLGLGGIALGFALKDILSNLVSGILILLGHTFKIGDQIVVGQTEGTVERIELRTTHIRTYDGRLVLVPNAEVFTSRVTNNTASPLRRASVSIYIDYGEDHERALAIIREAVARVPGVAAHPAASVRLRDMTPQHLHIEARIWTQSMRPEFVSTMSAVRIEILNALAKEGIGLPDPDRRRVKPINAPEPVNTLTPSGCTKGLIR